MWGDHPFGTILETIDHFKVKQKYFKIRNAHTQINHAAIGEGLLAPAETCE